jgi:hypothetical protein
MVVAMHRIHNIYDILPQPQGAQQRRVNKERLAQLEAQGRERRERLHRVALLLARPTAEDRAA